MYCSGSKKAQRHAVDRTAKVVAHRLATIDLSDFYHRPPRHTKYKLTTATNTMMREILATATPGAIFTLRNLETIVVLCIIMCWYTY